MGPLTVGVRRAITARRWKVKGGTVSARSQVAVSRSITSGLVGGPSRSWILESRVGGFHQAMDRTADSSGQKSRSSFRLWSRMVDRGRRSCHKARDGVRWDVCQDSDRSSRLEWPNRPCHLRHPLIVDAQQWPPIRSRSSRSERGVRLRFRGQWRAPVSVAVESAILLMRCPSFHANGSHWNESRCRGTCIKSIRSVPNKTVKRTPTRGEYIACRPRRPPAMSSPRPAYGRNVGSAYRWR